MKQFWREVGLAVVLGMIMPGIILHIVTYSSHRYVIRDNPSTVTIPREAEPFMIPVLTKDGTIQNMELETYLVGVVLAEMPASFEEEALKAQAVVARTYTLRSNNGKSKHEGAAVCMDSSCCQAYQAPESYLREYGDHGALEKVTNAVADTKDYVLTFQGELIDATYFSCSGGSTEDALAVWGADIPYLQSVPSPGEENAAHYSDTSTFSQQELEALLGHGLGEPQAQWFDDVTYTSGGGVNSIKIGGVEYQGTQVRKMLGLRSTAFTVSISGENVTFHTRGFGHRVGMSQYGADAMAVDGNNYEEILQHYYQGTQLQRYEN